MSATERNGHSLELSGGRRVRWRQGGAAEGHALFYCHGLPGSRFESRLLETSAATLGLRVICLDRPGYGGTSPLPGRIMGDETGDLQAVADSLGLQRFDVLGFSAGGAHALGCAARLSERVQRLSLVSSCAPFDRAPRNGMAQHFRELWDLAERDPSAFRYTLEQSLTAAGGAYELLIEGAPEEDRAILTRSDISRTYRRNAAEALRQGMDGMCEDARALVAPWPFEIEEVACPVHVWHGEHDRNVPFEMGRWLANRLPRAHMTRWPEGAHFAALERWPWILESHARPS